MNCDATRSLLDLDDVDARVDRDALRRHFELCPACVGRYADVAMLLGAPAPSSRPGRRSPRAVASVAAAAALLLAAIVLFDAAPLDVPAQAPTGVAAAEPTMLPADADADSDQGDEGRIRWLPAGVSRVSRTVVRMDRGRTSFSTVQHETVSASRGLGLR